MSTNFELSRIYAQGWNMAAKLTPGQERVFKAQGMDALNPYAGADQRARWAEGFQRGAGTFQQLAPSPRARATARAAMTVHKIRYRRPEAPWSLTQMTTQTAEDAATQIQRLIALGYSVTDVTPSLAPASDAH